MARTSKPPCAPIRPLDDRVLDPVQGQMPPEVFQIARQGLESEYLPLRSGQHRGQQRVISHVGSQVVDNRSNGDRSDKQRPFPDFVASQPISMIAGSDDPFLPAQGSLQDRHNRLPWNQPQRKAHYFSEQRIIGNACPVHKNSDPDHPLIK
jgi:hypothetical protein